MSALTRRKFTAGAAMMFGGAIVSGPIVAAENTARDWLHETPYIDKTHPRVLETARQITETSNDPLEKARAVFSFVRDEIKFGFTRGFWDNRASDILRMGMGYCNTKSTLFIALLRANDIPARQVFVDIHASVLHGIVSPGTPYVDHSYVEVWLDGAWVATDAYIVDRALFDPAQARVKEESRLMGYGVHATGAADWDGRTASFSQFNQLDPRPISTRHWGVYEDVGDFYKKATQPWNRLNPLLRASFGTFGGAANRRANRLRDRA